MTWPTLPLPPFNDPGASHDRDGYRFVAPAEVRLTEKSCNRVLDDHHTVVVRHDRVGLSE